MKNSSAPPATSMLVVFCTCPPREARQLARALVEQRVAACVNVTPSVDSVYFWQGTLQQEEEALLIIKSNEAQWPRLLRLLTRIHPYEVPEIIALPVARANLEYHQWVEENLCAD